MKFFEQVNMTFSLLGAKAVNKSQAIKPNHNEPWLAVMVGGDLRGSGIFCKFARFWDGLLRLYSFLRRLCACS